MTTKLLLTAKKNWETAKKNCQAAVTVSKGGPQNQGWGFLEGAEPGAIFQMQITGHQR